MYPELISRVSTFYKAIKMILPINQSGIVIPDLKYISISFANPFDRIDDIFSKGYLMRIYELKRGNFILGQTLRDRILSRSAANSNYSDAEIMEFLSSSLKTLTYMETEHNIFHGGISPSSFFLVGNYFRKEESTSTLALLDTGFFYWHDPLKNLTEFFRNFSENGEEFWFTSPEVRHNYFNPSL